MNARNFEAARVSLTGNRKNNQDRCIILSHHNTTLIALADGLGGHPRGEVAAQLFIDICESLFRQAELPLENPAEFMTACIHKAHQAIITFGDRQSPPICPRTTAVMTILQDGFAHWVHVGDSRFYLVRNDAIVAQTRDHSQVQYIRPSASAGSKTRSNITRCLGGLDQPPTITAAPVTALEANDSLILCSDGLWGQVPQDQLIEALSVVDNFESAITSLAQDAAKQGYPRSDNVTAVALRWQPEAAPLKHEGGIVEHADQVLESAVRHIRSVLKKPTL